MASWAQSPRELRIWLDADGLAASQKFVPSCSTDATPWATSGREPGCWNVSADGVRLEFEMRCAQLAEPLIRLDRWRQCVGSAGSRVVRQTAEMRSRGGGGEGGPEESKEYRRAIPRD